MILGYPDRPSGLPAKDFVFHIATDAPAFRIEIYDVSQAQLWISPVMTPVADNPNPPFALGNVDWSWPAYTVTLPDLPSGAYLAFFSESVGGVFTTPDFASIDGNAFKPLALLVVRSANPGAQTPILYKLSWATFNAYNGSGNVSLYAGAIWDANANPPGYKVTLRRVGSGAGGIVEGGDTPDFYAPGSRRQTFAHWDPPMIRWLAANQYPVDYCTDFDLYQDPNLLANYQLLLSVGHDEYWSEAARNQVESFIDQGGNVAFLSGNTCWWRIHYVENDTAIVCDKASKSDQWYVAQPVARPENSMTGVSYRNGGGRWEGAREALGYTVQHSDHWVYAGTNLANGAVFGNSPDFPLIGYECDGAEFNWVNGTARPTGNDNTPANFLILGIGRFTLLNGPLAWMNQNGMATATMGTYTSTSPGGGTVFTAATTDWPLLLGRDAAVDQITRNVIDRLSVGQSVPLFGPSPLVTRSGIVGIAGYYAAGDGFQHVIVARRDGTLTEIYWKPQDPSVGGVSAGVLPVEPFTSGIVGVAGYYAEGDGYQHVIVATQDGTLTEVYWKPQDPSVQGVGAGPLAAVDDSIVSIAGYYSAADKLQRVVVATRRGPLFLFDFPGNGGRIRRRLLTRKDGVAAIAGYYADSDGYQHLIITRGSTVDELFFKP